MSLRDIVTGSDVCTPSDGAGPSNAVGTLVNTLLGGSSKAQEQLRELPYVQPGFQGSAPLFNTPEAAALAAASSSSVAIPGLMPPGLRDGAHLMGLMPPGAHFHEGASAEEMEQLFASVQQQQQPGGMLGAPTPRGALLGAMPPQPPALQQLLHGFVGSGRSQSHFLPPPTPLGPQLSVPDKVRIRDRATIMARHMFADQGDIYAEQQVQNLLASLAINPAELPRDMPHVHDASWHEVWRGGAVARPAGPPPSVAADVAAGAAHFEAIWADRQQRQQQQQGGGGGASVAWAEEFHAEGRGGAGGGWASEYLSDASATTTATTTSGRIVAADAVDARASSARVVQALGADPKMASSQFFKFMSKMSKGDILFEDNRLVEGPGVGLQRHGGGGGQAWAEEFSSRGVAAAAAAPGSWGDEFHHHQQQQRPHGDWADEFASGLADDFGRQLGISGQQQQQQGGEAAEQEYERLWRQVASGSEWADELAAAVGTGAGGLGDLDDDATFEEWEKLYGGGSGGGAAGLGGGSGEYVFAENNPFLEDTQSFAKGRELFRQGVLSEAALALEAEVRRSPGNAEAWRLLGTVQAENDDDRQAIAAMSRALEADPGSADVLLALGVSHTNELDAEKAVGFLLRWAELQPGGVEAVAGAGPLQDSSQAVAHALRVFSALSQAQPGNADAQLALGVLHHLGRQYNAAVAAFRRALDLRPSDYSLWNKLGATLANHAHSADALSAYQKALDLKPNYMRAWTNMGISYANIGDYDQSARYYVRALQLNGGAAHVWAYLRTSLACAGRLELMAAVDSQDVAALSRELAL